MRLLDGMPLEKEIVGVMSKIKKLKEKDLLDPSLDPKDIREKLNPDDNLVLFKTVKDYVDTYYVTLKEIIIVFETPYNTGTGSNYKGMIVYDLAVLFSTSLPALAHDSLLFKNLGKDVEDGIIRIYTSTNK